MSDVAKFSLKDIKGWLEREAGSTMAPVRSKAQKLIDEMSKALDSLSEVSKMLLDNSAKEIEKRNLKTYRRARALNKLARLFAERMRLIRAPDKITYDSFDKFVQETQKAFLVTDTDIKNFFPLVSPFFILDRRRFQAVFEKSRDTLEDLSGFLTKDYVKTKKLEGALQLIDELHSLEQQLTSLEEQRTRVQNQKTQVEQEAAKTQRRISELKSAGSLGQLGQATKEIAVLTVEVKQSLRHLQKPFIKLQSLALHGEGSGLTPEETNKLSRYLQNPFEALATEIPEYPILRQILQKLACSMSEGKLKLKREKARKAEQAIETILNKNYLEDLHQKSMNLLARKKRLSMSSETTETEMEISKLKEQLEGLERKRKLAEGEQTTVDRTYNDTLERIRDHKAETEKDILDSLGKRVHIE